MRAIHLAAVTLVCAGLNIHADDQLTIWIDTPALYEKLVSGAMGYQVVLEQQPA